MLPLGRVVLSQLCATGGCRFDPIAPLRPGLRPRYRTSGTVKRSYRSARIGVRCDGLAPQILGQR
eukprot:12350969-Alexandrium_andersonii.AAC.1